MMNCFCGMVDRWKVFSLISSRDHCQRSSPSRISDMLRAGFELAQNLSLGLLEWSCAVVITTTPRLHKIFMDYSKRLQVSLPLIIRESTSNNISPTMDKFSYENLSTFSLKVYKYLNGHSPDMNYIFMLRENLYNLWIFHIFQTQYSFIKIWSWCYSISC